MFFRVMLIALAGLIFNGCCSDRPQFRELYSWGVPTNEETARKYAEAGVTATRVRNQKQFDLAVKYGMTPYCGTFTPASPHAQVMSEAETEYFRYISGADIDRKKIGKEEFKAIINRRRREKNHRYGGEVEAGVMDTNSKNIACFNSDKNFVMSRKKIDRIIAGAPRGVKGIYFDFLGYTNHHGCYCEVCLKDYQKFLKAGNLPDNTENRNIFYRTLLIDYYNAMIDYVKSKHPDFKVLVHIYPVFQPDPLYANRTKSDLCGQTVAWYFAWPEEKIYAYTRNVVENAKDHFPDAEGIPFVGLNSNPDSSLAYKSPEQLEAELKVILAAGGRTLQVCNGSDIIKPGYFEVFKKYCGKQ